MSRTVVTARRESERRSSRFSSRRRTAVISSVIVGVSTLLSSLEAGSAQATQQWPAQPSDSAPVEGRADYDDRVAEITVSPLEAFPGGIVHVTGTCTLWGFAATYAHISFSPADDTIPSTGVSVPVDPDSGRIDADVVVPLDAHPGPNTLGWMCAADDMVFGAHDERVPFSVLGPAPTTPPTTPPPGSAGSGGSLEPSVAGGAAVGAASAEALAATGLPDRTVTWIALGLLVVAGGTMVMFVRGRSRGRRGRSSPSFSRAIR